MGDVISAADLMFLEQVRIYRGDYSLPRTFHFGALSLCRRHHQKANALSHEEHGAGISFLNISLTSLVR